MHDIRKHNQELNNKHVDDETNDQNDKMFITKSEEIDLILDIESVHFPAFEKYNYRLNGPTEFFPLLTNRHSILHHAIMRDKKGFHIVKIMDHVNILKNIIMCKNVHVL